MSEYELYLIEASRLNKSSIKQLVNLTREMRIREILTSKLTKEEQLYLIDREYLFTKVTYEKPLDVFESYYNVNNDYQLSYIEIINTLNDNNIEDEFWTIGCDRSGEEIIKPRQEVIDTLYAHALKTRSSSYWTNT